MSVTDPQRWSLGRSALQSALSWLLPSPCVRCGEPTARPTPIPEEPAAGLGLCPTCRRSADPLWQPGRVAACRGCARPLAAADVPAGYRCAACRRRPPVVEALWVGWSFEPPLSDVVTAFKFRRLDFLGDEMGRVLAGDLVGGWTEAERRGIDLVVPVPLPWTRRLRRGFNSAEVLAAPIAERLDRPLERRLSRRPGRRQTGLSRHRRRRNLEGRLRCPRRLMGERVLLVDDVVTTGVTLNTAARCLLRAGAESVVALAAVRTPDPIDRSCPPGLYSGSS